MAAFMFSKYLSYYLREVAIRWKGLDACTWERPTALLGDLDDYEWSQGAKKQFEENKLRKCKESLCGTSPG